LRRRAWDRRGHRLWRLLQHRRWCDSPEYRAWFGPLGRRSCDDRREREGSEWRRILWWTPGGAPDVQFTGTGILSIPLYADRAQVAASLSLDLTGATISAAPEPASWALLLLGVGGIGAAMRMSRRKSDAALATA
jgi:hypothetical protein